MTSLRAAADAGARGCLVGVLLALLAASAVAQDGAVETADEWRKLQTAYDHAFTEVPVKRLFGDPEKELKISRRAPFTKAARDEIAARRTKDRLERAQILDERQRRDDIVRRMGALGGDRAATLLMRTWEAQLDNIDIAQKNLDRFVEANSVNINPGVDPGGVYWQRWMNKHEVPAARNVLRAEQRVKDLALEQSAKLMTPPVKEWLAKHAQDHERVWVREEMVAVLAQSGDPENVVALGRILGAEPAVWARVMIVLALGENDAPGAGAFVMRALTDEAWPVRSAAMASLGALGLRDTDAVDALVARVENEDGRMRYTARHALAVATGETLGLEPSEWRTWWDAARPGWKTPASAAKPGVFTAGLPVFCGATTASKRIAFLVSRGARMAEPTKGRTKRGGEIGVDTAQQIAAFELEQTLESLPADALFTVIVYGAEPALWSKQLKTPTRENRAKAVRFVKKALPEGASFLAGALEAALRMGVDKQVEDLALGGVGDVDTIFVIGGNLNAVGTLGGPLTGKAVLPRVRRYRRVRITSVRPGVN